MTNRSERRVRINELLCLDTYMHFWRFICRCHGRKRIDVFSLGFCSFLFSIGVVDRLGVEQRSLGSLLVFWFSPVNTYVPKKHEC